ncbi:MAG TPA: putative Na+/H+ antiporter, partial [Methylotenera sp.]|nr:putative Na+/H+ antiporter [Methylotenera sp.]
MISHDMNVVAAIIFALALVHTFTAKSFAVLAHRHPNHAGLFHLLGEVEVVFGFWAFILIGLLAIFSGGHQAISYVESRHYTEPLFVFVVMVVAASRPVLEVVKSAIQSAASIIPINNTLAQVWLGLAIVPL